jgi:hypothetical protein
MKYKCLSGTIQSSLRSHHSLVMYCICCPNFHTSLCSQGFCLCLDSYVCRWIVFWIQKIWSSLIVPQFDLLLSFWTLSLFMFGRKVLCSYYHGFVVCSILVWALQNFIAKRIYSLGGGEGGGVLFELKITQWSWWFFIVSLSHSFGIWTPSIHLSSFSSI